MLRTQPGEGPWGRGGGRGREKGLFPLRGRGLRGLAGEAGGRRRAQGGGPRKDSCFRFPQAHTGSSPVVCRRVHLVSVGGGRESGQP